MTNKKSSPYSLELVETRVLENLKATEAWASELLPLMSERQILGLSGSLGSGKTHFVKSLAKSMGVSEGEVNSPTFALHHEYQLHNLSLQKKHEALHHWDLYRLESEEEIESSGFWDLFYENKVIIAVEWVERISESALPLNFNYWRLDWEILPDGSRKASRYQR